MGKDEGEEHTWAHATIFFFGTRPSGGFRFVGGVFLSVYGGLWWVF